MSSHEVDLTGDECYFCGRGQSQLNEMQKKVESVLGASASSSSTRISKLEANHKKKIAEAQKILKRIKGKLKLSTIRTDLDAFVGEEEPCDEWTYSKAPAINIVRDMLCAGIPIGQECGGSSEYVTSIREYAEHEYNDFSFSVEEKKKIYALYEKWIEVTNADDFGYSGHKLTEVEIPFKKLLPLYLDWIPLMFKCDFAFCEDYNKACEELAEKETDAGNVPNIRLHKLELHSGSSEDVSITITRCEICADQLNRIESALEDHATHY
jgi:hypothetical protein